MDFRGGEYGGGASSSPPFPTAGPPAPAASLEAPQPFVASSNPPLARRTDPLPLESRKFPCSFGTGALKPPPPPAPSPPNECCGDSVAVARGIPAEGGIAQAVTGGGADIPPPPAPPPPLPPALGRRLLGTSYAGCGPEPAAAAAAASVSAELLRRSGKAGVYSTSNSSAIPRRYSCDVNT